MSITSNTYGSHWDNRGHDNVEIVAVIKFLCVSYASFSLASVLCGNAGVCVCGSVK